MAKPKPDRWANEPRGPYVRLLDGRKYHFLDPQPEDFGNLAEIARHLAGQNRYTGGSRLTVAQHMVTAALMARKFYPKEELLPARMLAHDVAEARLGDISSPLKSLLPDYKSLEQLAEAAVEKRFDILFIGDPLVKEVDDRCWLTERLIVYRGIDCAEDYNGPLEPFPLDRLDLVSYFDPWPAEKAERLWLHHARLHLEHQ